MQRAAPVLALLALLLAAYSPFDADAPRTLVATLSVGEPAGLPDGTVAVVELRAMTGDGPAAADANVVLDDAALPLEVSFQVDPASLDAQTRYGVRAALIIEGELRWLSALQPINVRHARIDAGELRLEPFDPGLLSGAGAGQPVEMEAEEAFFLCGDGLITLERDGEGALLRVEDGEYALGPALTADTPGIILHSSEDGTVRFEDGGATARYIINGEAGPDCVRLM
ncbi:MAG: YbaY family lipoprotein [Glycocaulis sp.]